MPVKRFILLPTTISHVITGLSQRNYRCIYTAIFGAFYRISHPPFCQGCCSKPGTAKGFILQQHIKTSLLAVAALQECIHKKQHIQTHK